MTDPKPTDPNDLYDDPRDSAEPDPYDADSDTADTDDTTPATGRRRFPVALIAVSVIMLIAIGVGLGVAFVPTSPLPSAAATPGTAASAGAATDAPTVPTALPLPQAIGEYNSPDQIVQVGDAAVTRGDFVRTYQPGEDPQQVIDQLVELELVVQEARSEGATIDEAAIDQQIADVRAQNEITDDAAFATFLNKNKIVSVEELRDLLARDQLVEQMLLKHTTMEQAHARHILLAATADKIEARKAEAEALLKDLQGGADFAATAREKSEDPGSKDSGGDLGWQPRGLFVAPFDEAVFSMKKGELRLVQSDFGWHIIELLDEPEVRSIESRDILNTTPGSEAFQTTFLPWVAELRKNAEAGNKIKVLIPSDQLVQAPGQ